MNSTRFLGILAPFPRKHYLSDGWYKRISMIDHTLEGLPKVYINSIHEKPAGRDFHVHESGSIEVFYSNSSQELSSTARNFINAIKIMYIHTTHLGEDFFKLGFETPFIIDFHGVAPEEEEFLDNHSLAKKLQVIETQLYFESQIRVFVSDGMKKHFDEKYSPRESVNLPIISDVRPNVVSPKRLELERNPKSAIYAGGLQKWQNIEKVFAVSIDLDFDLTIATNSSRSLLRKYSRRFEILNCNAKELAELYTKMTFGFIIRDRSIVNEVAFPTKLYEYIANGVIPIVDFDNLGGLKNRGLQSVGAMDLLTNSFDPLMFKKFRERNLEIAKDIEVEFLRSGKYLRDFILDVINS